MRRARRPLERGRPGRRPDAELQLYVAELRRCRRAGARNAREGLLVAMTMPPALVARGMLAVPEVQGDPLTDAEVLALASHYHDLSAELVHLVASAKA